MENKKTKKIGFEEPSNSNKTSEKKDENKTCRNWAITKYNKFIDFEEFKKEFENREKWFGQLQYIVIGNEICPTTGKPHQ